MSDLAQPLGQRLKAERERRGMSTQKAADEMHLDAWVIDALEAGDYQRIGPSVYAKGHLKKYASILGVPPAEIAAEYEPKSAPAVALAPQPASMRVRSAPPEATDLPWRQIAAAAAIVLGVVGILWWRPWQQRSGAHTVVAQAGSPIAPSPIAPSSAVSPAAASSSSNAGSSRVAQDAQRSPEPENSSNVSTGPVVAASVAGASPPPVASVASAASAVMPAMLAKSASAASAADATPGAGPARLRLSFSADSWVEVHDSTGRRVFAGNGRANSVKTISGTAPLKVYLGFASGVQLEVNERAVAIGPQFVTGDVARFEAGADGVLRRDSRALPANGVQTGTASPRG
ncbi:MAG: helix-turn-helix domain-containing protein [Steroidobacteraceae bacterium]